MTFLMFHATIKNMSERITETLINAETNRIIKETKGPIDAFVPLADREARDLLKDGGVLRPGIFQNSAIFDDSEESKHQKNDRYDIKRLLEIQRMAEESEYFSDKNPLEMRLAELSLQHNTNRSALVEAARKWKIESDNGILDDRNLRLYSECIDAAQEALYPDYDETIAQSSINKILAKISGTPEANNLTSKYDFMQSKEIQNGVYLSQELRKQWYDMLHERYDRVFQAVEQEFTESGLNLSNETLPLAAKTLMKHLDMPIRPEDPDGWDVVEDLERSGWLTDPGTKTSYSGKRSLDVTWPSFSRLMMHEVVFHAGRAENGSRTGYDSLQTGLPGSNDSEEGVALLLETLWTGKDPDTLGRDDFRYLAVAYADGKLDGIKHNEQETYDFTYEVMKNAGFAKQDKDGIYAGALDHTRRAFRGMPEGKVMKSNYAYRTGKVGAIRTLSESKLSPRELFDRLLIGKYDDRNAEQSEIIDEIIASRG